MLAVSCAAIEQRARHQVASMVGAGLMILARGGLILGKQAYWHAGVFTW